MAAARASRSTRNDNGVVDQPSNARRAAAMARSTSASSPRRITPATASVAGFTTSKGSPPLTGGTQWPSM